MFCFISSSLGLVHKEKGLGMFEIKSNNTELLSFRDFNQILANLIKLCLLTLLSLIFLLFPKISLASDSHKEWTVMIYMCADNDLEEMALYDFLEMEQGITDDINVIVLMDRARGQTSLYGDFTDTKLYEVKKSPSKIDYSGLITGNVALPKQLESKVIMELGELDMSDPSNLVHFVKECANRYPAQRYAFIPWNHGGGWKSMIMDLDGGKGVKGKGDMMVSEFASALREAVNYLPKKRFDAIIFEMCLMGQMDVLYELSDLADYAFASPPVMPAVGINYAEVLPYFNKDISTKDLVNKIVTSSKSYLEENHLLECAFSAYDLSKVKSVTDTILSLNRYLLGLVERDYHALTQSLSYATHVNSIETDVLYGKPAYWSVSLPDWLNQLGKITNIDKSYLNAVRGALDALILSTQSTPNARELEGVAVYLPMRREFVDTRYLTTRFAKDSGFINFLDNLYQAQEFKGNKQPRIENIKIGNVKLKKGRSGDSAYDFDLTEVNTIKPFDKSVIRFDVTGENVLWTYLYQLEKVAEGYRIDFKQLVRDYSQKNVSDKDGFFSKTTPHYNNGTTSIMREITAQKYVITNGQITTDISIQNTSTTDSFNDNISIGYAKYLDPALNGQELFVKLKFNNRTRLLTGAEVISDSNGNFSGTAIALKPDGILKPAISVMDKKGNITNKFGTPFKLGSVLALTLGMVDNNSTIVEMLRAQSVGGKTAISLSKPVKVVQDKAQMALIENTLKNGFTGLFGDYALFQYATTADEVDILPNFRILSLKQDRNSRAIFEMRDSNGEQVGHGRINFILAGTPQLTLHLPHSNSKVPMLGPTIQGYFCFLDGTGPQRQWYLVGLGDGTRSLLIPLEQLNPQDLQGQWQSATELWTFKGNEVELYRHKEKLKAKGTFSVTNNLIKALNMPFDEYCYYIDKDNTHMTLITRDGHASFLTKVNSSSAIKKENNTDRTVSASAEGDYLIGNYLSGADTGNAALTIQRVNNSKQFSAYMQTKGQGNISFVFNLSPEYFAAVFPNGERQNVGFRFNNNTLTLFFKNMPPITFKKM